MHAIRGTGTMRSWWKLGVAALAVSLMVPVAPVGAGEITEDKVMDTLFGMGTSAPKAVALAVDDGHDPDVLVEQTAAGNLQKNGTIVEGGEVLTPAGPPAGIITRPGQDGEFTIAQLNKAVKRTNATFVAELDLGATTKRDNAALMAMLVIVLALRGYDAEQILLDGLISDRIRIVDDRGTLEWGIIDADGNQLTPARRPSTQHDPTALQDAAITEIAARASDDSTSDDEKPRKGPYADFCELAGPWAESPSFDVALLAQLDELAPIDLDNGLSDFSGLHSIYERGGPSAAPSATKAAELQRIVDEAIAYLTEEIPEICR